MPTLTATVSSKAEVKLAPALRRKLTTALQTYAKHTADIKALEAKRDQIKDELGTLRDETGQDSVKLDGLGTVTLVLGYRKKFNEKKFMALGGDLAIYRQALDEKPNKPYTKVSLATETDSEDDE